MRGAGGKALATDHRALKPRNPFFRAFSQLLKLRFTAMVTYLIQLLKLQKIDKVMETINEKWKRKKLIKITYLIKRLLSEYDNSKAEKIELHLSEKILNFYDEWYDDFKNMNKIEEINKKCNLEMTSDEKFDLLLKLQEIDKVMKKIDEKWKRKRSINITYLIKKILSEYDNSKAKKIELNFLEKMLNFYDEWYDEFSKKMKKIEEINKKFN